MSASGVIVEIGSRRFLLPFDRVAFVAPLRQLEDGMLVMPRGRLPVVDPCSRLGVAPGEQPRTAIAVKGRFGFYALAVNAVELFEESAAGAEASLTQLDPETFLSAEEEKLMFPEEGGSGG